jgi:hypothetical protein
MKKESKKGIWKKQKTQVGLRKIKEGIREAQIAS